MENHTNIVLEFDYTPVLSLTGISCFLSIIGSVFIFLSYFKTDSNSRTYTKQLLLILTVADSLNAVGNIIGTFRYVSKDTHVKYDASGPINCTDVSESVCVTQSFITTSASMASFWWTFYAALNHLLYHQNSRMLEQKFFKILCFLTGWGLPVLITSVALGYDALGDGYSVSSGPWCWIKDCPNVDKKLSPAIWMAVTGKIWEIAAYIFTFALYMLLKFILWRKKRKERNSVFKSQSISYQSIPLDDYSKNNNLIKDITQEERKFGLLWIFFYMYLTRIWGTIRYFIYIGFGGSITVDYWDKFNTVLMYMQSVGDSAQAFVNFLGFVLFVHCQERRNKRGQIQNTDITQSKI